MIQGYVSKRDLQTRSRKRQISKEREDALTNRMYNKIRIGAFKTIKRRPKAIPETEEKSDHSFDQNEENKSDGSNDWKMSQGLLFSLNK